MLIWLPSHQFNLVLHVEGKGDKLGQGQDHSKVKLYFTYYRPADGPSTERHSY